MSQHKTRLSEKHSIFGSALQQLPLLELPTRLQVARHFLFLKENKYKTNKEVIPFLADTIVNLWIRAGIPPQSLNAVKTKISRLMEEGSQACKHGKNAAKTKKFLDSLDQLFDIAGCQCDDLDVCRCEKHMKVPERERKFLVDQRTTRKMMIGGVDKEVTAKMKRRKGREDRLKEREAEEKKRKSDQTEHSAVRESTSFASDVSLDKTVSGSSSESEEEWKGEGGTVSMYEERNMIPIPTIAREADRYGISNRAAAAISTATLIDYGMVESEDNTFVVDQHKIRRARQKLRSDLRKDRYAAEKEEEEIKALFFDGRKDLTRVKEMLSGKWYGKEMMEDHYVLVGEPGTSYLQHVTVQRGTGSIIAEEIHKSIQEIGIAEKIHAVGADSTVVNTGHKNGVIHLLECKLGRPMQWLICCLHLNELPLRHLCKAIIGPTQGPTEWKGPIGKALSTCETLPLPTSGFKCITTDDPLPTVNLDELSRDQAYLYKMLVAIRSGNVEENLLREKPGKMSMARWVTTANRICRLYVATEAPSDDLYSLAKFVVCIYGPMWFQIKCHAKCTDGSYNFLQQIKLTALLTKSEKETVWPVIQRNSYWAHHENVLLAMLGDGEIVNRVMAIAIIKSIRNGRPSEPTAAQNIRKFVLPEVKQTARNLQDLLPAINECTSEPPLTIDMSIAELEKIAQNPLSISIPCHSQGVERCVRMVTEASTAVYGTEARDGYIRARIKSREIIPSFETKKNFIV